MRNVHLFIVLSMKAWNELKVVRDFLTDPMKEYKKVSKTDYN